MAFGGKFDFFLRSLHPDVAVVPECAAPEAKSVRKVHECASLSGHAWMGGNVHKGLAVFTFGSYRIANRQEGTGASRYSMHASIEGPFPFELVAAWTQAPGYVENAHAALDAHRETLESGRAILAGDLNSSAKFDREHRPNHSALVERLRDQFSMESAYHSCFGERQGEESRPTYVHSTRRPFHIDYAFVPSSWRKRLAVEVGRHEEWGSLSDHYPLVLDLADAGG
jgi:hypothetical protein